MNDRDDSTLVAGSLRGDEGCFRALVERYEKPVYNLAYRMSGDRDDAQDITQSAFVKAFENLSTFDPHRKFFSWLYRIAMNEALNFQRARKENVAPTEDLESDAPRHDRLLEDAEARKRLEQAVAALEPDLRSVVILHYFSDCSYGDVSDILGVPERTIKSRLYVAREKLRRLLNQRRYR